MKKLLFLFSAILLSFAFIPMQDYAETSENTGLKRFIPQGKIIFSEIETVEKSKRNTELEKSLQFEDKPDGSILNFLSEKARIKENTSSGENEYSKIIRTNSHLSYDIKKTAESIEFRSTKDTYPNFSLNSEENSIVLGEKTYSFSTKMNIEHSENAFNSAWTGFVYKKGKSNIVLAKLDNNHFGILIQLPNKKPQVFIENQ